MLAEAKAHRGQRAQARRAGARLRPDAVARRRAVPQAGRHGRRAPPSAGAVGQDASAEQRRRAGARRRGAVAPCRHRQPDHAQARSGLHRPASGAGRRQGAGQRRRLSDRGRGHPAVREDRRRLFHHRRPAAACRCWRHCASSERSMAEQRKKAFVCGHPIAHSRSPKIHGHWLETYGIAGSYQAIDVAPADFAEFLQTLAGERLSPAATSPSRTRRRPSRWSSGATRRPKRSARSTRCGSRTACCGAATPMRYGFAANLDERAPGWASEGPAVVLGAGGASRAVIHALKERGFSDIRIVNRTLARAQELADRFGAGVSGASARRRPASCWPMPACSSTRRRSACMAMKASPPTWRGCRTMRIVTDIVYVPLETPLLAAARGARPEDGRRARHAAAPGGARLRALVRQAAGGHGRTART